MNLEMTWQMVWKEGRCFTYFSAAARKHHNQGNLQRRNLFGLQLQRDESTMVKQR